jgi:O-antigen ligase
MIKTQANSNSSKSKGQVIFEYALLAVCLCVIALRTTFTENPNPQSANQPTELSDTVYTLSISAVLIFSFLLWCVWIFWRRKFSLRLTAIEIGLCLFTIAAIIAGLAASDKRAAITHFVTVLAPILMAILLVQILNSKPKIILVLTVVAALGVVSAYQCSSQLLTGNKELIKFYEKYPDEVLARQNITPNTLKHWQFKHRLYSEDISGFFTTSNSAGSFALLTSFAGIALFIGNLRNRKLTQPLVVCGSGVAIIIFGLVITRSKGALTASVIAAAMFALCLLFPNWLKSHKKIVLIICLLLTAAVGCTVLSYGLTNGRLPGGNSMFVRWQYWQASARMYANHYRTGIGPGNFAHSYFHYKPPSALEEVSDPHNFLLSTLTQYGPVGLVGLLAMIFLPLWRVIAGGPVSPSTQAQQPRWSIRKFAAPFAVIISVSLLLIRPIVIPIETGGMIGVTAAVIFYVVLILYVAPVVAFAVGFWLLTANRGNKENADLKYVRAALFCAVCGFIIHNLIDFAIFEPGAATAFWAIMACLIAVHYHQQRTHPLILTPTLPVKILITAAGIALFWVYSNYAFIPVVKSTAKIRQATRASTVAEFNLAHNLLATAVKDDPFSSTAASLNGELYSHDFKTAVNKNPNSLHAAEDALLEAINRDNAYFKDFERLTEVYTLLAEISSGQEKTRRLNEALRTAKQAIRRHPGCARLHFERAKIAEQLDKTNTAIEHYRKAVYIENSYRDQFREMYPDEEIVSRLGEGKYQFARQRIKQLSKQKAP